MSEFESFLDTAEDLGYNRQNLEAAINALSDEEKQTLLDMTQSLESQAGVLADWGDLFPQAKTDAAVVSNVTDTSVDNTISNRANQDVSDTIAANGGSAADQENATEITNKATTQKQKQGLGKQFRGGQ